MREESPLAESYNCVQENERFLCPINRGVPETYLPGIAESVEYRIQTRAVIEENISFLDRIIRAAAFSRSLVHQWEQVKQYIQNRLQYHNLFLAVVGEFSTGKSTFINSLLKNSLLTAKLRPTTNVSTYISYGKQFVVHYQDQKGNFHRVEPKGDLSPREIVTRLTANKDESQRPDKVFIHYDSYLLKNGLVIIDTPGTNSPIPGHEKITADVVYKEADACVLVFDINQAGTISVFDFVRETLSEHLDRFIFVATKADHIFENRFDDGRPVREQLDETVSVLKQKISDHLGIRNPDVYLLASKEILHPGDPSIYFLQYVALQETFEKDLMNFLRKEKESIILKRLIMEEKIMLNVLQDECSQLYRQSEEELEMLQNMKIPALQDFIDDQYKELENDIGLISLRLKSQCNMDYFNACEEIKKGINRMIGQVSVKKELSDLCKTKLPDYLQKNIPPRLKKLEEKNGEQFAAEFQEVSDRLEYRFREVYNRLEQFRDSPGVDVSFSLVPIGMNSIKNMNDSINVMALEIDASSDFTCNSVAAGAVIGSIIPAVGTIVGGIIGALFGAIFGKSLEELKSQLCPRIIEKITENLEKWKDHIDTRLNRMISDCHQQLNRKLTFYYSEYNREIESMIADHREQLEHGTRQLRHKKTIRDELQERYDRLVTVYDSLIA